MSFSQIWSNKYRFFVCFGKAEKFTQVGFFLAKLLFTILTVGSIKFSHSDKFQNKVQKFKSTKNIILTVSNKLFPSDISE